MFIVLCSQGHEQELEVMTHDPDALVGDLAKALSNEAALAGAPRCTVAVLHLDGQPLDHQRRLDRAPIRNGSLLELVASGYEPALVKPLARRINSFASSWQLHVVGGLDSGARMNLPYGSLQVGRRGADIELSSATVSAHHATLTVDGKGVNLADNASLNGSWIATQPVTKPTPIALATVVRVGAEQFTISPAACAAQRDRGGRRGLSTPFNRPPRPAGPSPLTSIRAPEPPAQTQRSTRIGVVAVLAPLAMGLVMIKVFGSLMFGLFALLSPVMMIGSALESRRNNKRSGRRSRVQFAQELGAFKNALADLCDQERERLNELVPDPAQVNARIEELSSTLWERRTAHWDNLQLRIGIGDIPWFPPVDAIAAAHPAVAGLIEQSAVICGAPVVADFSGGAVLGLVGNREAALSVARSLLMQATAHHGPADIALVVATSQAQAAVWDWAKWLPHTIDASQPERRRLASDPDQADGLLRGLLEQRSEGESTGEVHISQPTVLLVLDDVSLTLGRRSAARSVLRGMAGPVAGIVIAATEDQLPSTCTLLLELSDADGSACYTRLETGDRIEGVLCAGISESTARHSARSMACLEDPESSSANASLPAQVSLVSLLGNDPIDGPGLLRRWQAADDSGLATPIGLSEDGVLAVDLVRDGPHALVAGTTGAGKSELLRTLVAGLAIGFSPADVTFVLVDFKGGSAFDCCSDFPHTVGLVTDLDPHLAQRALRCMEAELRYRERRLRTAGVSDINELRTRAKAGRSQEPLPRLVVVIDEFATLKAELPDFIDSLVGVAQRGRSLGVHLVLATQRPSGAVSDNIRANTNLRIALRVQDSGDSSDVIDRPDAARISRSQPGRALARLGPGEVVALQTALSTGYASTNEARPIELRSFAFGSADSVARQGDMGLSCTTAPEAESADAEPSDLQRLVAAAQVAHRATGVPAPRRPWPDPLPAEVSLGQLRTQGDFAVAEFGTVGEVVNFALADDPDQQAQYPVGWEPAAGNLLLFGIPGSGITSACQSLGLALAARFSPTNVHIYALDFGAAGLSGLAALPHVGAVIGAAERERQARLVRWLRGELDERRAQPDPSRPALVLILDGMAGFRSEWDEAFMGVSEAFGQVFADGPGLGIYTVIGADRINAVPTALAALTRQRWLFRMADAHDYSAVGIAASAPPNLGPGGAFIVESRLEVRVARPAEKLEAAVFQVAEHWTGGTGTTPQTIASLSAEVGSHELRSSTDLGGDSWFLPLGVGEEQLAPAGFRLHPGEHGLIAGPSRSGRSTALLTLAALGRHHSKQLRIVGVANQRSPLQHCAELDELLSPADLAVALPGLSSEQRPQLLLIDDADLIDETEEQGELARLLARRNPALHMVVAGRNETLRTQYLHWTRTVRQSRCILLLQPDLDLDGDLAGTTLPRRSISRIGVGRGYLIDNGTCELIQVARNMV